MPTSSDYKENNNGEQFVVGEAEAIEEQAPYMEPASKATYSGNHSNKRKFSNTSKDISTNITGRQKSYGGNNSSSKKYSGDYGGSSYDRSQKPKKSSYDYTDRDSKYDYYGSKESSRKRSDGSKRRRSSRGYDRDDKHLRTNSITHVLCKLLKFQNCCTQTPNICVKFPDPSIPAPFRKPPQICFYPNRCCCPNPCCRDPCCVDQCCRDPCCIEQCCRDPCCRPCCCPCPEPPCCCAPKPCCCGCSPCCCPCKTVCYVKNPCCCWEPCCPKVPNYNNCNFYANQQDKQQQQQADQNKGWKKENVNKSCNDKDQYRKSSATTYGNSRSVNYEYKTETNDDKSSSSSRRSSPAGSPKYWGSKKPAYHSGSLSVKASTSDT